MSKELAKLTRKADAVAISASRLLSDQIKIIQGEIASWGKKLNIAASAKDREVIYELIRKRMKQLSRKLDALMAAQNELAGKTAAKVASNMTGLDIKYSAKRAEAITELVTPAQGENLAAVFTERMSNHLINTLRQATVEALREQAIAGGTLKELSKELAWKWIEKAKEPPVFVDAGGKAWNTQTYFQMQSRTNSMRIYNDCLIDDVARETGSDIMRISRGGDPNCHCFAWEGCIISISGKTKGLPTYEQARKGGCFHPNCTHTLEYVDEAIDSDEIELAKSHPVVQGKEDDADAQYDRRREIDIARKMRENGSISRSDAETLVDRDNLTDAIRTGLVRSDARQIVDALTDAQVRALITNGRTPRFEPTKKATKEDPHAADEKWIHGKRGGVVHISRTATVEDLVKVTGIKDAKTPEPAKMEELKPEPLPKFKTSKEATEHIEKTYGIACKGFEKFSVDFCQGMAEAVADVKSHIGNSERLQGVWTFAEYYKKVFEFMRTRIASRVAQLYGTTEDDPRIQSYIEARTKLQLKRQKISKSSKNYGCAYSWIGDSYKELNGIVLNNHLDTMDRRREVSSGYKAQGCENPISTVYHELGHIIDYELGITDERSVQNDTIKKLWDKGRTDVAKNLSEYGSKNPKEMIAEAWAEYKMNPNARETALTIGKELDRICAERTKKDA